MSRMFASRMLGNVSAGGGGGGTFPAVGDVRDGVVYGPTDNLEGTAVDFAQPLADLDDANLSPFEDAALQSLVSMYDQMGVAADLTSGGSTTRIAFIIEGKSQSLEDRDGHRMEVEVLRGSVMAHIVTAPALGDTLTLLAANGTRTYRLTKQPMQSDSHLEWDLELQRATKVKLGTGGGPVA